MWLYNFSAHNLNAQIITIGLGRKFALQSHYKIAQEYNGCSAAANLEIHKLLTTNDAHDPLRAALSSSRAVRTN